MKPSKQLSSRARLREYLTAKLIALELGEPSHEGLALENLLQEAIDGLDDLDLGECPAIFARTKVKDRFKYPARIRRYRLRAVGYVDLLHRLGHSKEQARFIVADAYSVSERYVKEWCLTLGKDTSPEALVARAISFMSYRASQVFKRPFSEERLFAEMKKVGEKLKLAKIPKRPPKKPDTK